jgi:hypothetical protein
LTDALFRAGKDFDVLPLPSLTHMASDPMVTDVDQSGGVFSEALGEGEVTSELFDKLWNETENPFEILRECRFYVRKFPIKLRLLLISLLQTLASKDEWISMHEIVDLSERMAENQYTDEQRNQFNARYHRSRTATALLSFDAYDGIFELTSAFQVPARIFGGKCNDPRWVRIRHQLTDIFGNPFRPIALDPRWQSSTVLDLARTIYDQRTFENMPILGAGCDSDEIIQHCQGPGPHVRGCWVVDFILGKS